MGGFHPRGIWRYSCSLQCRWITELVGQQTTMLLCFQLFAMFTAKDCHDCISPPAEQKPVTQQLLTGGERSDEKIAPCWLQTSFSSTLFTSPSLGFTY